MKAKFEFTTDKEYFEYLRTHFAAMAMQGLCASGFGTDKHIQSQTEEVGSNVSEAMAVFSVDIANALIAQLNKE